MVPKIIGKKLVEFRILKYSVFNEINEIKFKKSQIYE